MLKTLKNNLKNDPNQRRYSLQERSNSVFQKPFYQIFNATLKR